MSEDERYMSRCIELTVRLGAVNVAPNPLVGAVLVYEGSIIAEGYHTNNTVKHAEVVILIPLPESINR